MATTDVIIRGPDGKTGGKVTRQGQQVVGPLDFSDPIKLDITATDQAFNFRGPEVGQIFIITEIIINSGSGAAQSMEIYESDSDVSLNVTKSFLSPTLAAKQFEPMVGLNWKVSEGVWLNAKSTSGTSASITIAGYYAKA